MSKYLVTLKPIEAFFFGSERSFGFYDRSKKGVELENNIIKSRKFPQQTSILGMLRKEILIKEKNLFKEDWDYNDAERKKIYKLIGQGFKLKGQEQNFGVIKRISPVFIAQITKSNHRFFMNIPKDHDISTENSEVKEYRPLKFNKNNTYCRCNLSENIYLPVGFVAKKGISEDFIDVKTRQIVKSTDIFKIDNYIGIQLNKQRMTEENSLFRLMKYKFNYDKKVEFANKAFVFTADIDYELEGYKNIVSLGGESSFFSINFEKVNFDITDKIQNINDFNGVYRKIILLSDTYIERIDYNAFCEYSIANSISFKTLNNKNYKKSNEKFYYNNFEKSHKKYSFLERGSVLFTTDDKYQKLIKSISKKNLQKIGYNIFI